MCLLEQDALHFDMKQELCSHLRHQIEHFSINKQMGLYLMFYTSKWFGNTTEYQRAQPPGSEKTLENALKSHINSRNKVSA